MKTQFFILACVALLLTACQTGQAPTNNNQGNQAPVASFSASVSQGQVALSVTFDASSSSDDGSITSFNWDFGDGKSASGEKVEHTFNQAGQFNVNLRVTDNQGLVASQSTQITVTSSTNPNPTNPNPSNPNPTNPNPTDPNNPNPTNPAPNESVSLEAGWSASLSVIATPEQLTGLAFDVVLEVSRQAGTDSIVGTGTLSETSQGVFSYDPNPTDKLIFSRLNGAELEFSFTDLRGDFTRDSGIYLSQDHSAVFSLKGNAQAGSINATIQHKKLPRAESRVRDTLESFEGSFNDQNNISWTANVATQGEELSDVDSVGLESVTQTQGNLSSDTLGFSMNVARTLKYKTINLVFDIQKSFADSWQFAGSTYQMNDVQTRTIFRETQPVDTDLWVLQGTLSKDGAVIGQTQDNSDATNYQFDLVAGDAKFGLFGQSKF